MTDDREPDDLLGELKRAGEGLASVRAASDEELGALDRATRQFEWIVNVLGERGVLTPADRKLLKRISPNTTRVQLATFRDKQSITGADIDCAARLHLCKARCCSFKVLLAEEDVVEGKLRWIVDEPYVLKREPDGYCTHLRQDGGCDCYGARPATCRTYDCREDARVWLDFEGRVPAPLPSWLERAQQTTEHDPDRRTPGS